ncbi:hypothetical protein Tco_1321760, partial [Tanacetum coccineum]
MSVNCFSRNINPVAAKQVALDNDLVPPEKRLKIKKCNARIDHCRVPEICPRLLNQDFVEPPSEDELVTFIQELGYSGKCASLGKQQDLIDSKNQELKSCRDKTISMRNRINLHTVRDDTLLGRLKFVSKTQDYQQKATLKKSRKFKKVASPSRKLSPILEEEPVVKPKRAKKPAKKSTTVPTTG